MDEFKNYTIIEVDINIANNMDIKNNIDRLSRKNNIEGNHISELGGDNIINRKNNKNKLNIDNNAYNR